MKNSEFCHLHVHNEYSQLDGFGTAEQYAARAKELGFTHLALTNHGNVDGLIKFQNACDKHGIQPVLGCEAYIVPDALNKEKGERRGHITLLVKNKRGWKNLLRLMNYANMEGFYRRPRIDYPTLLKHCEGLCILTGCSGSFLTLPGGSELLADLNEKIPGDLYLEIMPHELDVQTNINKICSEINVVYPKDFPFVATADCHYIDKEDAMAQEVLLAVGTKAKWNDKDRFRFTCESFYLHTADEMRRAFRKQKQFDKKTVRTAIRNTMKVAEKCCRFRIKKKDISLPAVSTINSEKSDKAYLRMLCKKGLKRIGKHNDKAYSKRFKMEYDMIVGKGFERYFLIVWELVNWCKDNDIMTGPGRGSVGGSLIAYLLGITKVDPIEYGLLFARFISEERIDYPDIDLDFEDRKRYLVREHLMDLYGENNISGVSTFLTMKGRGALRDVARVFDVPNKEVDEAAKAIDDDPDSKNRNDKIKTAMEETPEGRAFAAKYPVVVEIAIKLEGQVRGSGQHAAAIIVSNNDLTKGARTNLAVRNKVVVCNWEKDDAEYVGLMKLDVLGLNTLSILNETKHLIKQNRDKDIEFDKIEFNDKRVLKDFAQGKNVGCFQFNSYGMVELCKKMKIDSFDLLVHANALYRPGPLRSGMVDKFIANRKKGKWKTANKEVRDITASTYGIPVYQEQVMFIANKVAGMSWKEADKIRKVIGKSKGKDALNEFKEAFIAGCMKTAHMKKKDAEALWHELEEFGGYGFNKSHAVEYTMIGYWCQYCKVYFGPEFICASLTYGAEDKKEELVEKAYQLGLEVLPPKVGISQAERWLVKQDKLYAPFIEIKGVGEKTAIKLAAGKAKTSGAKGFFKLQSVEQIANPETKVGQILEEIGAYNKSSVPKSAAKYFAFKLQTDGERHGKRT